MYNSEFSAETVVQVLLGLLLDSKSFTNLQTNVDYLAGKKYHWMVGQLLFIEYGKTQENFINLWTLRDIH